MILRNLNTQNNIEVSFIESLYIKSFPLSERRPVDMMLELYSKNPRFEIGIVIKDENPVGFLTYWNLSKFIFAEHFAISPEFRNEGYGQKTMELFIKEIARPIVLEVELPTTILSERRIGFYQRLGFRLWENIQYLQPAYHTNGNAIPMKLMSYGDIDLAQNITEIRNLIYSEVYNC